jgi:hypothetical protein
MTEEEDKLKAQRERINARLRQLKGKEKRVARTTDNRRKILAGAFLLEQAKRHPAVKDWMLHGFAWFLTRPDERALFDLAPRLVTDKAEGGAPPPASDMPPEFMQDNRAGASSSPHGSP